MKRKRLEGRHHQLQPPQQEQNHQHLRRPQPYHCHQQQQRKQSELVTTIGNITGGLLGIPFTFIILSTTRTLAGIL